MTDRQYFCGFSIYRFLLPINPTLEYLFRQLCIFAALMLLTALSSAEPSKPSKTLEQIRKRGFITIGVKTDFPPFGMLNTQGEPEGLEVDLASDIARQLGVKLVKTSITTENRFQKLEQGGVDIIIATTADTLERRRIATAIEPNYYAGGVDVFLRPEQHLSDWQSMRGQKICATQGAYFNRPMSQRYLLDLQMYRSTRDALLALRDGRCVGFLYSSAAIQAYLKKPEWAGYKVPLPPAMVAPWAINISRKEQDSELDRWLGDIVANWHRSGFLIELERVWGVQETKFLKDEQAEWTQRDANGQYICVRNSEGHWPTQCRNPTFVRYAEVGGLLRLGLWIEENTGMKLSFIYDNYDRSLFAQGLFYTVLIMTLCVFFSLLLGVVGALLMESAHTRVRPWLHGFAVYGRMTPPLLQMYLLFFGVGALISKLSGMGFSPLWVAVWCLSYYTSASIMNTFVESAQHIRVRYPDFRLRRSNFSTILEVSAIPVKVALVNVVKQSAMTSALAIPELISATTSIMSDEGNVGVMMNVFFIVFLLLITGWIHFLDWLEKKMRVHQKASHE